MEIITAGAASGTAVRLTRRGRLVVLMALLVLMVTVGALAGHGSGQASTHGGAPTRSVTVEPGESLWTVAARVAPHRDPRLVVSSIESMNGLTSSEVFAGQELRVPGN